MRMRGLGGKRGRVNAPYKWREVKHTFLQRRSRVSLFNFFSWRMRVGHSSGGGAFFFLLKPGVDRLIDYTMGSKIWPGSGPDVCYALVIYLIGGKHNFFYLCSPTKNIISKFGSPNSRLLDTQRLAGAASHNVSRGTKRRMPTIVLLVFIHLPLFPVAEILVCWRRFSTVAEEERHEDNAVTGFQSLWLRWWRGQSSAFTNAAATGVF